MGEAQALCPPQSSGFVQGASEEAEAGVPEHTWAQKNHTVKNVKNRLEGRRSVRSLSKCNSNWEQETHSTDVSSKDQSRT